MLLVSKDNLIDILSNFEYIFSPPAPSPRIWETNYRVSLKKGSFRIPAPMEALGYSKGLDISQKHCQTSFFYTLSHDYMPTLY